MSESLAERVLCVIEARLRGILQLDGLATSAGRKVVRALRSLEDADLPALVIWCDGRAPSMLTCRPTRTAPARCSSASAPM